LRKYEKHSVQELRAIYQGISDDPEALSELLNEFPCRTLEEVFFILKGSHPKPSRKNGCNKLVVGDRREKNIANSENKQSLIWVGQEIEPGIIVLCINHENGTFLARESGEEFEYNIVDFIPGYMATSLVEQTDTSKLQKDHDELKPVRDTSTQITTTSNLSSSPACKAVPKVKMHGTIRHIGEAHDAPAPKEPPLEDSLKLRFGKDDSLAIRYGKTLDELIKEMKSDKSSVKHITLESGRSLNVEGKMGIYQFPFDGEGELFEGANVIGLLDGVRANGQIVSVLPGSIVISFQGDLPSFVAKCDIRVDNTAMLQSLREKLALVEKGELAEFNTTMADAVIHNEGEENPPESFEGFSDLNEKQREAVARTLGNSIQYLWGPPGTGKTQTISALIQIFMERGKKALLCSNTNQAVDQVLLKLCKDSNKGELNRLLTEDKVIRVGKIAHQELDTKYGDMVSLERIVDRESASLKQRQEEIEREVSKIEPLIIESRRIIDAFKMLRRLESEQRKTTQSLQQSREKLKQAESDYSRFATKLTKLNKQLDDTLNAGILKKIILKSPEKIQAEINRTSGLVKSAQEKFATHREAAQEAERRVDDVLARIQDAEKKLEGKDLKQAEHQLTEAEAKKQPLVDELAEISHKLGDIAKSVVENAALVGATITKTFLSPQLFKNFDVVIIDEASMVSLPALYYVAGLSKEKVVVSGDSRQLSSIVQSNQRAIQEIVGRDIFTINRFTEAKGKSKKHFLMLEEQFRMDDSICQLISARMYQGKLRTSPKRQPSTLEVPPPLNERLLIIDTSPIVPFVNRDRYKSRYNLMNALAIRNLCLHLKDQGFVSSVSRVGVCTPYAAQAKLVQGILAGAGISEEEIQAGTVHRYQGDEKNVMILDIPDSEGEYKVGMFLQAVSAEQNGARLFNVGLSRAKDHLFVLANLDYLDRKLPNFAFLRGVLADMVMRGQVMDVRDVIALRPIWDDLKKFRNKIELSLESLENGLFSQKDFHEVFLADIDAARTGILIHSGFITPQRVALYDAAFRTKTHGGVPIRCVTRPPSRNGSMSFEETQKALVALEQMGCIVDTRVGAHEKVAIIDDRILWFGSLNPLSHTGNTSEMMARIEDTRLAKQVADFLALDKKTDSNYIGENPTCPECNSRTAFIIGKRGPFWSCENCDWKANYRQAKATTNSEPNIESISVTCPACGSPMRRKHGRFGDFFGCSKYPDCKETVRTTSQD
jgi:superfamily I DNA and/or RNA helicase/predicted nucleic acid-binding Zn ribbon protein